MAAEAVCLIFPSPLFVFSVHWDTTRYRGSVILWMSSSNSCPIQSARVGIVLSWKTRVLGSQYLTCLLSDFDLHASSSQTRWSSIIQFLSKFYLLFIHSIFQFNIRWALPVSRFTSVFTWNSLMNFIKQTWWKHRLARQNMPSGRSYISYSYLVPRWIMSLGQRS